MTHLGQEALSAVEREILARRAERLRATPPATTPDAQLVWLATFDLGGDRMGFPLSSLRGITPLRFVTSVPLAAPHVLGIVRFQGRIITAMSLAALVGRSWRNDPSVLLAVERDGGSVIAFDCDEIPAAVAVHADAFLAAKCEGRALSRLMTGDGAMVQVIDVEGLLSGNGAR